MQLSLLSFLLLVVHAHGWFHGRCDDDDDDNVLRFVTSASGTQEVPPVVSSTSATLTLLFAHDFSSVSYDLDVFQGTGIEFAHLHCGIAGTNGPIISFLFSSPGGVAANGDLSSGTLTNAEIMPVMCGDVNLVNIAALHEAILRRQVYLNVHSLANPPGEVRGQIF